MKALKEKFLKKTDENLLFIKSWVQNPKALGAIAPSSEALGKFISKQITLGSDEFIVEVGAGTGSLTDELLVSGIAPEKLIVVELDEKLAAFLRKKLPAQVCVIQGNAEDLAKILPDFARGHIATVISGIPMMNLRKDEQLRIISSCFDVMKEGGYLLQFTYGPLSPIPAKKLGLAKKRVGHVLMNIPPATIWRYQRLQQDV